MISLNAKIDLIKGEEIKDLSIDGLKNNISGNLTVGEFHRNTKNPFVLGSAILGESITFENEVDYFMGKHLSFSDGYFKDNWNNNIQTYSLDISSVDKETPLNYITICFDTKINQHPKTIELYKMDGNEKTHLKTYYVDYSIFVINLSEYAVSNIIIEIDNWNVVGRPLIISSVFVNLSIIINKQNLLSYEGDNFYKLDIDKNSFGIISNRGYIEFNDEYGDIEYFARKKLINNTLDINIFLHDSIKKTNIPISAYKTSIWNYDSNSKIAKITLMDDLQEWQEISTIMPLKPKSSAFEIFEVLKSVVPSKWIFAELDEKTQNALKKTVIFYPYLRNDNLWEQFKKICIICGLVLYKNIENKIVLSSVLEV